MAGIVSGRRDSDREAAHAPVAGLVGDRVHDIVGRPGGRRERGALVALEEETGSRARLRRPRVEEPTIIGSGGSARDLAWRLGGAEAAAKDGEAAASLHEDVAARAQATTAGDELASAAAAEAASTAMTDAGPAPSAAAEAASAADIASAATAAEAAGASHEGVAAPATPAAAAAVEATATPILADSAVPACRVVALENDIGQGYDRGTIGRTIVRPGNEQAAAQARAAAAAAAAARTADRMGVLDREILDRHLAGQDVEALMVCGGTVRVLPVQCAAVDALQGQGIARRKTDRGQVSGLGDRCPTRRSRARPCWPPSHLPPGWRRSSWAKVETVVATSVSVTSLAAAAARIADLQRHSPPLVKEAPCARPAKAPCTAAPPMLEISVYACPNTGV